MEQEIKALRQGIRRAAEFQADYVNKTAKSIKEIELKREIEYSKLSKKYKETFFELCDKEKLLLCVPCAVFAEKYNELCEECKKEVSNYISSDAFLLELYNIFVK